MDAKLRTIFSTKIFCFAGLLLLIILFMLIATPQKAFAQEISIDASTFPDSTFRTALQDKYGFVVETDEVVRLDVSNKGSIASLEGIGNFTNLVYLDCFGNSLTELDLSANTRLTYLDCHNNSLGSGGGE